MRGEEGIRGVGQTADRQSRVGGAKLVLRLVQGEREGESKYFTPVCRWWEARQVWIIHTLSPYRLTSHTTALFIHRLGSSLPQHCLVHARSLHPHLTYEQKASCILCLFNQINTKKKNSYGWLKKSGNRFWMMWKILPALSLSVRLTMSLTFFEDFSAFLGTLSLSSPSNHTNTNV